MAKYLDDLFILSGCVLILIGTWQICPLATWFVGGGMLVAGGIAIGIGAQSPQGGREARSNEK